MRPAVVELKLSSISVSASSMITWLTKAGDIAPNLSANDKLPGVVTNKSTSRDLSRRLLIILYNGKTVPVLWKNLIGIFQKWVIQRPTILEFLRRFHWCSYISLHNWDSLGIRIIHCWNVVKMPYWCKDFCKQLRALEKCTLCTWCSWLDKVQHVAIYGPNWGSFFQFSVFYLKYNTFIWQGDRWLPNHS